MKGAAGQIMQWLGGGLEYFLHTDAVGSTTMDTDNTGTVQRDITFYPWGQTWNVSGSQFWENFGGLGHQVNGGFYPARHREYKPDWGRWNTPDPDNAGSDLGDSQSWNMYSYVGDNPTSRNDPSGEDYRVCQDGVNGASTNCTVLTDRQYDLFIGQNKDTLSFAGGKIFANGTQIGASEYIPTLDPSTALALHAVGEFSNTEIKRAAVSMAINGALAGVGALIGDWLAASREASSGDVIEATVHGAKRLAEASRLDPVQAIEAELQATMRYTQADGARVFVQEMSPGKFNVVVKNPTTNKIVTVLKSIDRRALDNLARNYGWR